MDIKDLGISMGSASLMNNKGLNILIYGEPGVGKTTLGATCSLVPEMSPVLLIDCEGGSLSIKNYSEIESMTIVRPENSADFNKILKFLENEGKGLFKTVIIDTLSSMQKFYADAINQIVPKKDLDKNPFLFWSKLGSAITEKLDRLRYIDSNIILLAHKTKTDQDNSLATFDALGKVTYSEIIRYFDLQAELIAETKISIKENERTTETTRILLTKEGINSICKSRINSLPNMIIEPDFKKIYDYAMDIDTRIS